MQTFSTKLRIAFVALALFILPQTAYAEEAGGEEFIVPLARLNVLIDAQIRDPYIFAGLAGFYNEIDVFVINGSELTRVGTEPVLPKAGEMLAITGRHRVLLIPELGSTVAFLDGEVSLPDAKSKVAKAHIVHKSELPPELRGLKYAYLLEPFRLLCLAIEALLLGINGVFGWGLSIVVLSIVLKLITLPANIWLTRVQERVAGVQARLEPVLAEIKANYKGEEAHHKFIAAHKQQGVTPFYTLKPLLLVLLPLPILISVFNVLGEVDQMAGHGFLWISDLALPDSVLDFDFFLPFFGDSLNLLPILMTLLTLVGARLHNSKAASASALRKQRRNLYLMAAFFFVLFYPFPAAMVLYWTLANLWHIVLTRVLLP